MPVKYSTTKSHPLLWLERLLWTRSCLLGEASCGGGVSTYLQGPGRLEERFYILAWAEVRYWAAHCGLDLLGSPRPKIN